MSTAPPGPAIDDLTRCVHCGLCLSACPTYLETGLEPEGPRGRIALMRALAEGAIAPTPGVTAHLDACVACRACEDVCPSGVPYGRIIEAQRVSERNRGQDPLLQQAFDLIFYRWLLPHPRVLETLGRAGALAARLGLLRVFRDTRLLGWATDFLPLPAPGYLPQSVEPQGPARGSVAVLEGCIMPLVLASVNAATVRVLTATGYRVLVPPDQVCCGALHAHRGYHDLAAALARRNIAAFEGSGADAIVVNSAGCGAMLKEYSQLLADDAQWASRAAAFSARVRDISELLAPLSERPSGRLRRRVTYQESCHLGHAQRVKRQARELLRAVEDLEFVEMAEADVCCGSGGVYTLLQPAMSLQLLDRTMRHVEAVRPDIIVTANPGCILQLQAGVRRWRFDTPVLHVVEVLDEAIRNA